MILKWSIHGVLLTIGDKSYLLTWSEFRELELIIKEFGKINSVEIREGTLVHQQKGGEK